MSNPSQKAMEAAEPDILGMIRQRHCDDEPIFSVVSYSLPEYSMKDLWAMVDNFAAQAVEEERRMCAKEVIAKARYYMNDDPDPPSNAWSPMFALANQMCPALLDEFKEKRARGGAGGGEK